MCHLRIRSTKTAPGICSSLCWDVPFKFYTSIINTPLQHSLVTVVVPNALIYVASKSYFFKKLSLFSSLPLPRETHRTVVWNVTQCLVENNGGSWYITVAVIDCTSHNISFSAQAFWSEKLLAQYQALYQLVGVTAILLKEEIPFFIYKKRCSSLFQICIVFLMVQKKSHRKKICGFPRMKL